MHPQQEAKKAQGAQTRQSKNKRVEWQRQARKIRRGFSPAEGRGTRGNALHVGVDQCVEGASEVLGSPLAVILIVEPFGGVLADESGVMP